MSVASIFHAITQKAHDFLVSIFGQSALDKVDAEVKQVLSDDFLPIFKEAIEAASRFTRRRRRQALGRIQSDRVGVDRPGQEPSRSDHQPRDRTGVWTGKGEDRLTTCPTRAYWSQIPARISARPLPHLADLLPTRCRAHRRHPAGRRRDAGADPDVSADPLDGVDRLVPPAPRARAVAGVRGAQGLGAPEVRRPLAGGTSLQRKRMMAGRELALADLAQLRHLGGAACVGAGAAGAEAAA